VELELNTDRLYHCNIETSDSTFLLALINSRGWLEFIGDKKIKTEDACKEWIESVVLKQLRELGYTTMVIFRKEDHLPIGVVSLVKREYLEHLDI
jgi:ribosomal-protein-alanine N-acetyltransferase